MRAITVALRSQHETQIDFYELTLGSDFEY